jgi:hypothetical protein
VRSIVSPLLWLALAATALVASTAPGAELVVERLAGEETPPDPDAPLDWLAAPERRWTPAAEPGLIRVRDGLWWRIRVPADAGDADSHEALVLRDVFDARLTTWVGEDPRPRRLGTTRVGRPRGAEQLTDQREFGLGRDVRLIQLQGPVVGERGHLGVDVAEVFVRRGVTGVRADGLFQALLGALVLPLGGIEHGEVVVGLG